jgi:hypothetical protein
MHYSPVTVAELAPCGAHPLRQHLAKTAPANQGWGNKRAQEGVAGCFGAAGENKKTTPQRPSPRAVKCKTSAPAPAAEAKAIRATAITSPRFYEPTRQERAAPAGPRCSLRQNRTLVFLFRLGTGDCWLLVAVRSVLIARGREDIEQSPLGGLKAKGMWGAIYRTNPI